MKKIDFSCLKSSDLGRFKIVVSKEQISRHLGDEAAILNLKKGLYCGLNEVGACVWSQIQEPRSIQDILDILLNEYDVEPERCEREILSFLQQLADNDLIEVMNETNS
jgi:hypothetical protein